MVMEGRLKSHHAITTCACDPLSDWSAMVLRGEMDYLNSSAGPKHCFGIDGNIDFLCKVAGTPGCARRGGGSMLPKVVSSPLRLWLGSYFVPAVVRHMQWFQVIVASGSSRGRRRSGQRGLDSGRDPSGFCDGR